MNTSVSGRYYYILPTEQARRPLADFQAQLTGRAAGQDPAQIRFSAVARPPVSGNLAPPLAAGAPAARPLEGASPALPQRLTDLLTQERGRDLIGGGRADAPAPPESESGAFTLARLAGLGVKIQQVQGDGLREAREALYDRQAFAEGGVGMARQVPILIDRAV